jgi:hypothetical protein
MEDRPEAVRLADRQPPGRGRQGRRDGGAVSAVSVTSGKLAERARKAWQTAGLEAITLHECRHTYASFLMAAGSLVCK